MHAPTRRQRAAPSIRQPEEVEPLLKQVTCECGWSAKGTEDELVSQIQKHGREVHGMEITREQAIAQIVPAG
jgi:predicted small metal-binding protein